MQNNGCRCSWCRRFCRCVTVRCSPRLRTAPLMGLRAVHGVRRATFLGVNFVNFPDVWNLRFCSVRRINLGEVSGSVASPSVAPMQDKKRSWSIRDGVWGVLSEAQALVCRENIHDRAYLYIGVTSSSGAGLCGVPGEGDSKGIGAGICKIVQMNFREILFHALR